MHTAVVCVCVGGWGGWVCTYERGMLCVGRVTGSLALFHLVYAFIMKPSLSVLPRIFLRSSGGWGRH